MDEFLKTIRSYLATEKQEAQSQEIRFDKLIDCALESAKDHTNSSKLNININVSQDLPFYSNIPRISLALEHLLRNAVHYQDQHKPENIIDIEVLVNQTEAMIEIVDNGEGIPKEAQKDIFRPFVKVSKSSDGFGVGLYVAEKCLNDIGGYININSSHGIGTHCVIKIPNHGNRS